MNQAHFFQFKCSLKNSLINMLMFTSLSCELLKVDRNGNKHDRKCFQEPRLVGTLPSQHFLMSNGGSSFHRDDFVRLNTLEIVI